MEFPPEIIEMLKNYVYVYVDPISNNPFYIGKGYGNRVFQHLRDKSETEKTKRINEIRSQGEEPKIELLRFGLTENEARLIEAAVIDLYGTQNLTNQIRGYHTKSFGRVSIEEILSFYTAEPAAINQPSILIIINKLYRSNMVAEELYEATRGIWKLGKKREQAEFAFSVFQGTVREVYRIKKWQPAGTHRYQYRDIENFRTPGRWEFEGSIAEDVRDLYIGKSVRNYLGNHSQYPVRYLNIK